VPPAASAFTTRLVKGTAVASKSRTPRAIGGENIIVICFVALMSVYLYESFYLVPTLMSDYVGPSMFPQIIAILGLILAGIYFFQQRSAGAEGAAEDGQRSLSDELANLAPIGPIVLYVLLLEPIGFLFATAIYVLTAMLVYGRSVVESLVYALGLSTSFFAIFYYGLLAQVPMGWFIDTERVLPFLVQLRRAMGG
jgi:putative tricarboxylic transport membrane protein